jgi:hypothetical protein
MPEAPRLGMTLLRLISLTAGADRYLSDLAEVGGWVRVELAGGRQPDSFVVVGRGAREARFPIAELLMLARLADLGPEAAARIEPQGAARADHNRTAHIAASLLKGKLGKKHDMVVGLLASHPEGLTDREIDDAAVEAGHTSTLRPRRVELVRAGFVIDTGTTRRHSTRGPATVWKLAPKA